MVKVLEQDRTHPLFGVLNEHFDMRHDISHTTVRSRPNSRSDWPRSLLTELGRNIFSHCVEKWDALSEAQKQWYRDNAPPQFCTGFLWFTWSCLIKNYNAGPWTVGTSAIGGHCYIQPFGVDDEPNTKPYVGATELGTLASLVWESECPDEAFPILLVHGWNISFRGPQRTWKWMVNELTDLDPTHSSDFEWVYDPERPGDENWALRRLETGDRVVYISNYTHSPIDGTPGPIDGYALSLAHEIEIICAHERVEKVNLVTHSLGGLVARAYIENEDLPDGFQHITYRDDVNALIMIAPPNRGSVLAELVPKWTGWESVQQIKPGSVFLFTLNSGVTGLEKGVEYSIIAGNYFGCLPGWTGTFDLTEDLNVLWASLFKEIACETDYVGLPCYVTRYKRYWESISKMDIIMAATVCGLSFGVTNDGVLTIEETMLSNQAGKPEVPSERFHLLPQTHTGLLGSTQLPCNTAFTVELILANYTLEKWRAKGRHIEPPEANYLHRCLNLIGRTDASHIYYDHIVDENIIVEFGDVPEGSVAKWSPDDNAIRVDISAEAEEEKVTCQHIVHEAELSYWHSEDSISKAYWAYKAEAEFWDAVKKSDHDDHCDWVAGFIAQGREDAMEYIRTLPEYADLPEYSGVTEDFIEAFRILENRPTGTERCRDAQRAGLQLGYGIDPDLLTVHKLLGVDPPFARYDYETKEGVLADSWQDEPLEVIVAGLAYLVENAGQNVPDSITREYNAFFYMARIWNAIKGDLEHEFCDEVSFYMHFSEEIGRSWVRSRYEYAALPGQGAGIYSEPDGRLHVLFLDVGEGDAILIVTPGGKRILIDGGPSPVEMSAHIGRHLQVWDWHIAAVILSHADTDHIMGQLPVLERYIVFDAFDSGYPSDNRLYAHWMGFVKSRDTTYHKARSGMTIDTNDGVILTILHPGPQFMQGTGADSNNNSVVVRLEYQGVSFLFTGDIQAEAEQALLDSGYELESTVLKVSHHGAPEASTQEFLEAVNPEMAVISVGEDNWFDHPAEEVVERLEAIVGSDNLYRTDYNGTVEMTVEGGLTDLWFYPIQVIPPMPEEGEPPEEPSGKININTATQEELETLEGIGPSRAQGIIQNRYYETIEEVTNVPGIGPLTYLKIKDFICVMEGGDEEPEPDYLEACLDLVEQAEASSDIYDHLMEAEVTITFEDIPEGFSAQYDPIENAIRVNSTAQDEIPKVTAAYIVHEGEHSRWLGENSISQEYHAYKAQADFWNEVKEGDENDVCDWVSDFIAQGKEDAMEYIRTLEEYALLPEYSGVDWNLMEVFHTYENMPSGYAACLNSQRLGATVYYRHVTEGVFAWIWHDFIGGAINETWQDESQEANVAALAYLLERVEWNSPDSIDQEWHAFMKMADVWNAIKDGQEQGWCDTVAQYMALDEEEAKDWIRSQDAYADLPES